MSEFYAPARARYDVVIIGGAIMGAATAWFLTEMQGFDGRILVIERDMSFEQCSTAHTTSCIRQQFSNALNVQISQYGAEYIKTFREKLGGDLRVPQLGIRSFGYMYFADSESLADRLRRDCKVQNEAGACTRLLSAEEIKAEYPFYTVDDILLGSINTVDEGLFDAGAMCDWWRRLARERGVEFVQNEVVGMTLNRGKTAVDSVTLATGTRIALGQLVNASGPRAARVAAMAGIDVPIEPRKRYSWIFKAEKPLDRDLPLTIDPSGVHVRENGGGTYQAGGHGVPDPAVEPDDFSMDFSLWESEVWPVLATRIPQFEAVKLQSEWAGHYAMNTLDHNAVLGPHPEVRNFHFINGFSGHGLQQAPAMGRGLVELMVQGSFQSLDLTPFLFERITSGEVQVEDAVI